MVLTDTHAGNWNAASSGTLATRRYQLQNWRADVVATTIDNGDPYEYIRYSPYGIPTSYPAADANRNGVTNGTDTTDMIAVLGGGSAAVVCHIDLNKDGLYPDTADLDYCNDESVLTGKRGGFNKLGTATGSVAPQRFGYAGYAWDPAIKVNHVRHRVYSSELGRWMTRDPMGYIDGLSMFEYVSSHPVTLADWSGLYAGPPACFPLYTAYESALLNLAAALATLAGCALFFPTPPVMAACMTAAALWVASARAGQCAACQALQACEHTSAGSPSNTGINTDCSNCGVWPPGYTPPPPVPPWDERRWRDHPKRPITGTWPSGTCDVSPHPPTFDDCNTTWPGAPGLTVDILGANVASH